MENTLREDCYYLALDVGESTEFAIEFNENIDTFRTYSYYEDIYDRSQSFNIKEPTGDDSFKKLLAKIKPYLTLGCIVNLDQLELDKEEVIEFFLNNLNYEPYVADPYISTVELNSTYSIIYSHNLEGYSLDNIMQMILIYLHITNVGLEISEDNEYSIDGGCESYKLGPCTYDTLTKICDLVSSVVNIEGYEYAYNDGCYNRQSGYSKEGYYYHYDVEDNYLDQDVIDYIEYITPKSNIELAKQRLKELKGFNNKPALLVEHTRKLIYWLRIVKPLGINNVKKLEKYLLA